MKTTRVSMELVINGKKHTVALELGPNDFPKFFYEMIRSLFADRRFNPKGRTERKIIRFLTECIAACHPGPEA